jgi:hypothetical protein
MFGMLMHICVGKGWFFMRGTPLPSSMRLMSWRPTMNECITSVEVFNSKILTLDQLIFIYPDLWAATFLIGLMIMKTIDRCCEVESELLLPV